MIIYDYINMILIIIITQLIIYKISLINLLALIQMILLYIYIYIYIYIKHIFNNNTYYDEKYHQLIIK